MKFKRKSDFKNIVDSVASAEDSDFNELEDETDDIFPRRVSLAPTSQAVVSSGETQR